MNQNTARRARTMTLTAALGMGGVMGFFGNSYPKAGAAIWFAPETKGKPMPE